VSATTPFVKSSAPAVWIAVRGTLVADAKTDAGPMRRACAASCSVNAIQMCATPVVRSSTHNPLSFSVCVVVVVVVVVVACVQLGLRVHFGLVVPCVLHNNART